MSCFFYYMKEVLLIGWYKGSDPHISYNFSMRSFSRMNRIHVHSTDVPFFKEVASLYEISICRRFWRSWPTGVASLGRFYIAPAPGKMGYAAAVERWLIMFFCFWCKHAQILLALYPEYRFLKLLVTIWAGSQVTKIVRAGG